jgi:putative transposase
VTKAEDEAKRRAERAEQIGLFRYRLIQDLIDPALSTRQRGKRVRELAAAEHTDPFGQQVRISRNTLDRWARWWRAGGVAALVPQPARVHPRTPAEVLELAAALKREKPERTAAQIRRILATTSGWSPSDRTLQRLFERLELNHRIDGRDSAGSPGHAEVFGRFEADRPNELWVGDALHGPKIAGRKTYLFAFLDDHSRAVMAARFGHHEDVVRLAAALRPALAGRGVPGSVYVDNGSAFVDAWLLRACADLGIKLVHSTPGRPQGRGKIERWFRTVREQFLVELDPAACTDIASLAELNRLLAAWIEGVYHRAPHSETGMAPLARWQQGIADPLPLPSTAQLREAFLWRERRRVTKTATVSLHGNTYQVDPVLARRYIELIFDPFDLTDIDVRHDKRPAGKATVFTIGRHAHPKARPEPDDTPAGGPAEPTGIDYLRALDNARGKHLAQQINYAALYEHHHHQQPDDQPGERQ